MKKLDPSIRASSVFFIFTIILFVRIMSGDLTGWRSYFIPIAFVICCASMIYNLVKVFKKK